MHILKLITIFIVCVFALQDNIYASTLKDDEKKSFFQICNFNNVDEILNNSNTKFISAELENIEDENLKKALYIYIFFRDKQKMPFQLIDIIGMNNIKNIPSFKLNTISYAINNNVPDAEFKALIKQYSASQDFKLQVLKKVPVL